MAVAPASLAHLVERCPALYAKLQQQQQKHTQWQSQPFSSVHPLPTPALMTQRLPKPRQTPTARVCHADTDDSPFERDSDGGDSSKKRRGSFPFSTDMDPGAATGFAAASSPTWSLPVTATGAPTVTTEGGAALAHLAQAVHDDTRRSYTTNSAGTSLLHRLAANDPTLHALRITADEVWTPEDLFALCSALQQNHRVTSVEVTPAAYARVTRLALPDKDGWPQLMHACVGLPLHSLQLAGLGPLVGGIADAEAMTTLVAHTAGVETCGVARVVAGCRALGCCDHRTSDGAMATMAVTTVDMRSEAGTLTFLDLSGTQGLLSRLPVPDSTATLPPSPSSSVAYADTTNVSHQRQPSLSVAYTALSHRMSRCLFSPHSSLRVADLSQCALGDAALQPLLSVFLAQGQRAPLSALRVLRLRWNGLTAHRDTTRALAAFTRPRDGGRPTSATSSVRGSSFVSASLRAGSRGSVTSTIGTATAATAPAAYANAVAAGAATRWDHRQQVQRPSMAASCPMAGNGGRVEAGGDGVRRARASFFAAVESSCRASVAGVLQRPPLGPTGNPCEGCCLRAGAACVEDWVCVELEGNNVDPALYMH